MVERDGIEPSFTESKSVVLPLDDLSRNQRSLSNLLIYKSCFENGSRLSDLHGDGSTSKRERLNQRKSFLIICSSLRVVRVLIYQRGVLRYQSPALYPLAP